ncbi:hypothetical protein PF011_g8711 [Phytophthora fragariae]|uniref:DDE-1 domain-containing protein n=1 Tax=Phytophthora fragariae TaxID=53985 RepID=A0A6A3L1Q0_9STRA|nr:hypothetical protein PF011_g8711 [Phytophthora fragariae]
MLRMRLTKAQQLELCKHRKTCTRTGWLRHFQRRHGIRCRRAHGEIDSVDLVAARAEAERLRKVLADYNPSDVFNMDKAALFYQALPRRSLCVHAAPALKQRKARVTMVVGTNATGSEKLPLLILVTAKRPRSFTLGKKVRSSLGLNRTTFDSKVAGSEETTLYGSSAILDCCDSPRVSVV